MSIDWNLGMEMWKGVYRLGKGFETAIYDDEMSYSDIQILPLFPFYFFFILDLVSFSVSFSPPFFPRR